MKYMEAEIYTPNVLEERISDQGCSEKDLRNKVISKTLKTVRRLEKYSAKTEDDYNFKSPVLRKTAATLHNFPLRFAQANAGALPTSMQGLIADYRAKKGVNETPDEYVKYSIRFSYPLSTIKLLGGLGITYIPFLAKPGTGFAILGAYLLIIENPIRHYFRKKGKPIGLLLPLPYQFTELVVKRIIGNGKQSNKAENKENILEKRIDAPKKAGLDQKIKYEPLTVFPSPRF